MPAHKCCLFTGAVEEERRDVYVCLVPARCLKNLGGFSRICDGLILVDLGQENMNLMSQTNCFISHAQMLTLFTHFFNSGRQIQKPRKVD